MNVKCFIIARVGMTSADWDDTRRVHPQMSDRSRAATFLLPSSLGCNSAFRFDPHHYDGVRHVEMKNGIG